jgi:hypothetical protein
MPTHFVRLLAAAALVTCTTANAAIVTLTANLTPFQENPTAPLFGAGATSIGPAAGQLKAFTVGPGLEGGDRPLSFGFAEFTLNTDTPVLNMRVTINNIDVGGTQTPDIPNDNLVAAHIHAGPTAIPGQLAAPVVWGFFGAPFNDDDLDVTFTAHASGIGGTFEGQWDAGEGNNTTLIAHINNIFNGLSYINFHTDQFRGGEIRGQLRVPEPATTALLAAALLAICFARREPQKAKARA